MQLPVIFYAGAVNLRSQSRQKAADRAGTGPACSRLSSLARRSNGRQRQLSIEGSFAFRGQELPLPRPEQHRGPAAARPQGRQKNRRFRRVHRDGAHSGRRRHHQGLRLPPADPETCARGRQASSWSRTAARSALGVLLRAAAGGRRPPGSACSCTAWGSTPPLQARFFGRAGSGPAPSWPASTPAPLPALFRAALVVLRVVAAVVVSLFLLLFGSRWLQVMVEALRRL